eukprot:13563-Heterococcus_DN1.PRE.1
MALVAVWDLPQGVTEAISQAKLAAFFTFPTSGLPGYPGYRIHACHVTLACSQQSAAALVAFPTIATAVCLLSVYMSKLCAYAQFSVPQYVTCWHVTWAQIGAEISVATHSEMLCRSNCTKH